MQATTTSTERDTPAHSSTMRAIVQHRYGDPEVLELGEVPVPEIDDDQVLVRVAAAGVDRGVWHLVAGLPYVVRPMFGLRRPRNPVPGMDIAGEVVAVGAAVTRFEPGDQVFGIGIGTYAEYARAEEAKLVHRPDSLAVEAAAVTAISGLTGLQAMRRVDVRPGDSVLVVGASGGVGSYAVQVAKALGAVVTGVASTAKLDFVRSLGADHVVDHTAEDITAGDARYDVVIDIGGNTPLRRLRRILTPTGRLLVVGGEDGGRLFGGTHRQLWAMIRSRFTRQSLGAFLSAEDLDDLRDLAAMIDRGEVTPAVTATYPLAEAAQALRHLEDGRIRGKAVVIVR